MQIRVIQQYEVQSTFHEGRSVLEVLDSDGDRMCFAFSEEQAVESIKSMHDGVGSFTQVSRKAGVWEDV